MPQAATRCLAQAHGIGRFGQVRLLAAGSAGDNGAQAVLRQQYELRQLHGARQHAREHIAPATLPQRAQQRLALRQLACQRAGLQHLAGQARGLVPGVGAGLVGVGFRQAPRGVQRPRALDQPGVASVFGDLGKIHGVQLLPIPHTGRHGLAALGVGKGTIAERAVRTTAQGLQIQVGGDVQEQAQIALLRVALQPLGQGGFAAPGGDLFKRRAIQHAFQKTAQLCHTRAQAQALGRRQVARAAAGGNGMGVRPLAAQRAHELQPTLAHGQGFARVLPRQRRKALHGLGMPGAARIHLAREVGHEEQVEVREVVCRVLAGQHQVGEPHAVGRRLHAAGRRQRTRRRHRLRDRADAADARHHDQRVERVLALQDLLKAPVHGRIHPGLAYTARVHLQAHLQVTFHAVERAYQ